jgi:hypothetical protein
MMKTQTAIPPMWVPCPTCLAGVDEFCTDSDGQIQAALHDGRCRFARDPDVVRLMSVDWMVEAFLGGEL